MTNEPLSPPDNADASAEVPTETKAYRSKRGRRIMITVLVFLLILLLIATLFLLNLIRPKGDIASSEDTGITWVRSIYGWGPREDQQLLTPASVAFARNGDVIIPNVGTVNVRGLRFAPSGLYKSQFAGSPIAEDGTGFLAYPGAVSVGADGRMYFVQSPKDEIIRTDPTGQKTEGILKVQAPKSIDVSADRIAVGSQSGWVVTDLEGNPLVGPIGTWGRGADQYDAVGGIALDDENNVYVVDTYNNRISRFDAKGKRAWTVTTGAPGNNKTFTGGSDMQAQARDNDESESKLQSPGQAVLDAAGRLLVIDALDFSISAFDTKDGKFLAKYGAFGTDEGEMLYPSGLAYDSVRDWVAVADTMNNRVQIVRVPGTGGSAVSGLARSLSGPLRACLVPLLLLLIAAIAWIVRKRRQKKRALEAAALEAVEAEGESDLQEPASL